MKTILWSALLAGGLLLGGAAGVNAAPVATGGAIEAALADVSLVQDVRYRCGRHCVKRDRCGRCVRWRVVQCCPPIRKHKPYGYKPRKPKC
jgi:hypothetical protein